MDTDGKGMDTDGTFQALQCGCKGVGMHTDGTLQVKEECTQTDHHM